ncbi:alanine racemase [Microbacterium atlanticum]|uniref:alanine racemase n=1 Tax=Microbacterium atlanticum TaxID=2782168 RepID=UPI001888AF8D|nr:alanine racemase [Microbacterium atlanticum]
MTPALHVDLRALVANLARVRETVAPAEVMLVVKDDAYAHGLVPVVRAAAAAGVRWFGAFDARTAGAVRRLLGDDVRVFAWIAASDAELRAAAEADVDLGVGDADLLEDAAAAARSVGRTLRVHLKLDTGLHRNGVRPEAWPGFVARAAELQAEGAIHVTGVWSHIAEASDAEDDDARALFARGVRQAHEAGLRPALRHLAASAASFARPEFRYDMVRVGAFCYGIRSAGGPAAERLGLAPIGRLEAQVTSVEGGVARVGIGALHGLPSRLQGRATVGTPAGPRALLAVEGSESLVESWGGAAIGDRVTVFGPGSDGESSATDLAELIGTIGEEIAVRVSPLIPRVYAGE